MKTVILNSTGEGWHAEDLVRALGEVDEQQRGGAHVVGWENVEASVGGHADGHVNGRSDRSGGWMWRGNEGEKTVGEVVGKTQGNVGKNVGGSAGEKVGGVGGVDAIVLRAMGSASLEQIVFRMDVMLRLESQGVYFVNGPRSIEASVDKYRASGLIADAGVAVPATRVCQRVDDAMRAFEDLGGDVIVKPLFGSEGFGMMRVSDRGLAARAFATIGQIGGVMYVQKFVDHLHGVGGDYRLFVVGDQVVAAMQRRGVGGPDGAEAWRANVARGGTVVACALDGMNAAWQAMAVQAARACGANVAGVDVLVDRDGRAHVIEVNSSPGWKALAGITGVDVAGCIARYIWDAVHERKHKAVTAHA